MLRLSLGRRCLLSIAQYSHNLLNCHHEVVSATEGSAFPPAAKMQIFRAPENQAFATTILRARRLSAAYTSQYCANLNRPPGLFDRDYCRVALVPHRQLQRKPFLRRHPHDVRRHDDQQFVIIHVLVMHRGTIIHSRHTGQERIARQAQRIRL